MREFDEEYQAEMEREFRPRSWGFAFEVYGHDEEIKDAQLAEKPVVFTVSVFGVCPVEAGDEAHREAWDRAKGCHGAGVMLREVV